MKIKDDLASWEFVGFRTKQNLFRIYFAQIFANGLFFLLKARRFYLPGTKENVSLVSPEHIYMHI